MSLIYITCPSCGSPTALERVGVVGVRGVEDSRTIFCWACNIFFSSKGETFWEAIGRHP